MKKKLVLSAMLVCLLTLGLSLLGCPTDGGDDGGGGGGPTVDERYQGIYVNDLTNPTWTLEIKANTVEVKKGSDGAVKEMQVILVNKESDNYYIRVPNSDGGTDGYTGSLYFYLNDDGSLKYGNVETNIRGKLEYYPGDDDSGEAIPRYWYPKP
jgi:hypothetical protein